MSERLKHEQLETSSSLAMARQSLGRAKEMDLSPEQKQKILAMIKQAVKLEKSGDKVNALKAYQRVKQYLEQINPQDDIISFNGLKIKRFQAEFLKKTASSMLKTWMFLNPDRELEDYDQKQKELETQVVGFVKKLDDEGNIIEFDCENKTIEELPDLPPKLEVLNCDHNMLKSLPALPESLVELHCEYNQIENLPDLPSGLLILECSGNELSKLPALSPELEELRCGQNTKLKFNPDQPLPESLEKLNCWNCNLEELPALPKKLKKLECRLNKLTELPALPDSLEILSAADNYFFKLPALPDSLTGILCDNCRLTELPDLPKNLQYLFAEKNIFTDEAIAKIKAHPNYSSKDFKLKNLEDFS